MGYACVILIHMNSGKGDSEKNTQTINLIIGLMGQK